MLIPFGIIYLLQSWKFGFKCSSNTFSFVQFCCFTQLMKFDIFIYALIYAFLNKRDEGNFTVNNVSGFEKDVCLSSIDILNFGRCFLKVNLKYNLCGLVCYLCLLWECLQHGLWVITKNNLPLLRIMYPGRMTCLTVNFSC